MQRDDDNAEGSVNDAKAELRAFLKWKPGRLSDGDDVAATHAYALPSVLVANMRRMPRGYLPTLPNTRKLDVETVRWWIANVNVSMSNPIPESWIAEAWGLPYGPGRAEFKPLVPLLTEGGWHRGRTSQTSKRACAWQWFPGRLERPVKAEPVEEAGETVGAQEEPKDDDDLGFDLDALIASGGEE